MTADPLVAQMLTGDDVFLEDMRTHKKPMSLYLTIPFTDQERLLPLSRLIVRLVLDYNTRRLGPWNHRLLMLIDELQALKSMPPLVRALTYVRKYGLNLALITPSLHALGAEGDQYMENAHLRVIFAPNDPALSEKFSHMTGNEEVEKQGTTREQRLLSATGITYLPPDKGLLLIGNGGYPALITKAPYYRSYRLRRRSRYASSL
jgi:type IV secretion system protein VirD4